MINQLVIHIEFTFEVSKASLRSLLVGKTLLRVFEAYKIFKKETKKSIKVVQTKVLSCPNLPNYWSTLI